MASDKPGTDSNLRVEAMRARVLPRGLQIAGEEVRSVASAELVARTAVSGRHVARISDVLMGETKTSQTLAAWKRKATWTDDPEWAEPGGVGQRNAGVVA